MILFTRHSFILRFFAAVFADIIFWAFVLWASEQSVYALFFWAMYLRQHQKKSLWPQHAELKPVSIIICAKNEALNLNKNLPSVLEQEFNTKEGRRNYEVVVVDDGSDDNTAATISKLQAKYPHLRSIQLKKEIPRKFKGKKFALSQGLEAAANDWILMTDADCVPASNAWLTTMVTPLAMGKSICAGYAGYVPTNSLLNGFIRWETMHARLQGAAYALAGLPYLAVGRNIACTRDALLVAQASPIWDLSPSGDDDLLVTIAGSKKNYTVVDDHDSFTYTSSPETLSDWVKQKQRHLTDGKSYKGWVKFYLSAYGFTHAAVWVYYPALCFTHYWYEASILMAVRCLLYWGLWASCAKKLKEPGLLSLLPVFDFMWMIYNFTFLPYIVAKNKQQWK